MEHFSSLIEETTSENPPASTYRSGIESSHRDISDFARASGSIASVDRAVSDDWDWLPEEWLKQYSGEDVTTKDLPEQYRFHGMGKRGGKYHYDALRNRVNKLSEWDGVEKGGQRIGKKAYEADSHASDPEYVRAIFVGNFGSDTCDPGRPMRLGTDGEFENPSLKAAARVWISILVEHGFNWDVARNLVYGSIAIVDVVPVLASYDWSSKASKYTGDESYATAASVMQDPVEELMRVLPSLCPNSVGYFAFGSDAYKAMDRMSQLPLHILNDEKIVHPMMIHNKFCDTDQRSAYIKHSCSAMMAAFGMKISPDDIKDLDDIIKVTDGMKRKSEERLDSAIRKLDPDEKDVMLAEMRETYANMPPDEKDVMLAEMRETYANMPTEKKDVMLAERRETYANMPPDEKDVMLAEMRETYANLPQEKKDVKLARDRKRKAEMRANRTSEEKAVELAKRREGYANMIPAEKAVELAKGERDMQTRKQRKGSCSCRSNL